MKNKIFKISLITTVSFLASAGYAFADSTLRNIMTELTAIIGTTLIILLGGLVFVGFTINVIRMFTAVDADNKAEIKTRLIWSFGLLFLIVALFGIIQLVQGWFGFPSYFQDTGTVDDTFQVAPEVIDTSTFRQATQQTGTGPVVVDTDNTPGGTIPAPQPNPNNQPANPPANPPSTPTDTSIPSRPPVSPGSDTSG